MFENKDIFGMERKFYKGETFRNCNFKKTIESCKFEDCIFENCTFSCTIIRYSQIYRSHFKNCDLRHCVWHQSSHALSEFSGGTPPWMSHKFVNSVLQNVLTYEESIEILVGDIKGYCWEDYLGMVADLEREKTIMNRLEAIGNLPDVYYKWKEENKKCVDTEKH